MRRTCSNGRRNPSRHASRRAGAVLPEGAAPEAISRASLGALLPLPPEPLLCARLTPPLAVPPSAPLLRYRTAGDVSSPLQLPLWHLGYSLESPSAAPAPAWRARSRFPAAPSIPPAFPRDCH